MVCEAAGVPAVVVVTEVFANLARTAARARGVPTMRMLRPARIRWRRRPEPEVRAIARARFRDADRRADDRRGDRLIAGWRAAPSSPSS